MGRLHHDADLAGETVLERIHAGAYCLEIGSTDDGCAAFATGIVCPAHDSSHLFVAGVSEHEHVVAVADEFLRVSLRPRHDGAGGVDDFETGGFEVLHNPCADAVSGDCDPARWEFGSDQRPHVTVHFVRTGQLADATVTQSLHYIRVVDYLSDTVNRPLGRGFVLHDLHGPADAHAESHLSCSLDCHHRGRWPRSQYRHRHIPWVNRQGWRRR